MPGSAHPAAARPGARWNTRRLTWLIAAVLALQIVACAPATTPTQSGVGDSQAAVSAQTTIDVREAKRRQDAGALLIDVREPNEYAAGHPAGSVLIPLGQVENRAAEIPRDREVLVICQSGNRSRLAQQTLAGLGYTNVVNVDGGWNAWSGAGLPTER